MDRVLEKKVKYVRTEYIFHKNYDRNKLIENSIGFDSLISFLDGEGVYFNDYFNWRNIPQFNKLVYDSPAALIAAQLMDSRVR